ncbi:hypothetical protein NDU88_011379 [Pleurodeles waltl]|uniref:Uncharacterized protein n=1 Tax=Pleurodeles waltl TaxID=8319 RepID=A0AAV7S0X7_PLEWA|nr:hypothetical protein NDU88_011379 [Pleurodeles waltl]
MAYSDNANPEMKTNTVSHKSRVRPGTERGPIHPPNTHPPAHTEEVNTRTGQFPHLPWDKRGSHSGHSSGRAGGHEGSSKGAKKDTALPASSRCVHLRPAETGGQFVTRSYILHPESTTAQTETKRGPTISQVPYPPARHHTWLLATISTRCDFTAPHHSSASEEVYAWLEELHIAESGSTEPHHAATGL